jgi:RNA-directed DNA polymerase
METTLVRIAERSAVNPHQKWNSLMCHFNKENLLQCYYGLDGRKAVGIDKVTKEIYGENLDENLENLVKNLKKMAYHPQPVRETLIPKDDGKGGMRPLGISNLEDKIIQSLFSKILMGIYEPLMCDFSYGFRPKKSCHDAVKTLSVIIDDKRMEAIVDIDLKNYFGSIEHNKLLALLRMRIKDERFLRYISRMLKAGILSMGELRKDEWGTPQGSICTPRTQSITFLMGQWNYMLHVNNLFNCVNLHHIH